MTLHAGSGTHAHPEKLQAAKLQSREAAKPQSCTLRDSQSLATSFPKRQSEAPRSAKKRQEAARSAKKHQSVPNPTQHCDARRAAAFSDA